MPSSSGDDSLFAEVIDAADALHKLNVSIHYLSCGKTGAGGYPPSVNVPVREPTQRPQSEQ
jgi:hypothetical protein